MQAIFSTLNPTRKKNSLATSIARKGIKWNRYIHIHAEQHDGPACNLDDQF